VDPKRTHIDLSIRLDMASATHAVFDGYCTHQEKRIGLLVLIWHHLRTLLLMGTVGLHSATVPIKRRELQSV